MPAPRERRRRRYAHFITLMQENHTFDNYFGTYPGVDGIPKGACMPLDPAQGGSRCMKPFHIGNCHRASLDHSAATYRRPVSNGGHGRLRLGPATAATQDGRLAMGYYDGRDLPFYWNLADEYVLFDRFFSSAGAAASSTTCTGWPRARGSGYDRVPPNGFGNLPTIFDRLRAARVSWKFYVQNYDPTINFRARPARQPRVSGPSGCRSSLSARFLDDPARAAHRRPRRVLHGPATPGRCRRSRSSSPSGPSEHPPATPRSRPAASSAVVIDALDAQLGCADLRVHAGPTTTGAAGTTTCAAAGRRSASASASRRCSSARTRRRGYVDHTPLDFTSILRFIEDNWGARAPLDASAPQREQLRRRLRLLGRPAGAR